VVDEAAAMDDGRLVETMAVVIERGLLGRSRRRRQRYAAPGI
jgi:hypothetical protein